MRAEEPRPAAELLRLRCAAGSPTKVTMPTERHHRDEVLQEAEHRPVADERDRPVDGSRRVSSDQRAVRLEVDRRQDQERPEHEEVRGARDAPLEQLLLAEDLDDLASSPRAPSRPVTPSMRSGAGWPLVISR